jgi:hypothetical protein
MRTYVKGHYGRGGAWIRGHYMHENPEIRARHVRRIHEEERGLEESLHRKRMRM